MNTIDELLIEALRAIDRFWFVRTLHIFEEFLKPLGMKQTELAEKIGVPYSRINALIWGQRGITPDTALRLEQLFGMEAQFWLNLQLAWDLYHAVHSPTAKEIRKIKRLPTLVVVTGH